MDESQDILLLLVEDNAAYAKTLEKILTRHQPERFVVTWKSSGADALDELGRRDDLDAILMDYFLPDMTGLQITQAMRERNIATPVIFLTVNKDFDLAREVLMIGVEDYLLKEELSAPGVAKTILDVIERERLRRQLTELEMSSHRLEAIRELIAVITAEIRVPLDTMARIYEDLLGRHKEDALRNYLGIIRDNHARIESKIVKLKELKSDQTVPYIKDIKMFDIS